jgi:hypothetical protein
MTIRFTAHRPVAPLVPYDKGKPGAARRIPAGRLGIAARTDYIVNGKRDALAFVTASKTNGCEGRPLCVHTGRRIDLAGAAGSPMSPKDSPSCPPVRSARRPHPHRPQCEEGPTGSSLRIVRRRRHLALITSPQFHRRHERKRPA